MDDELFESLLYQEESAYLDFKRDQYPFDKATDKQKSKLLKDLLAFANSWRRADAYILIGVEEVRGGRSKVVGLQEHLLNRNLQQFVSSKTNRPLEFDYLPYNFHDLQVGILRIPLQERPLFLPKSYGKVEANKVYIRRSDATGIANPDEIARMGISHVREGLTEQPTLELQFADVENRVLLGQNLKLHSSILTLPMMEEIPLFYSEYANIAFGENRNYYRDIAIYLKETKLLNSIGSHVKNAGKILAENVFISMSIPKHSELVLISEEEYPDTPSTSRFHVPTGIPLLARQGNLSLHEHHNRLSIEINVGNIQPGAEAWSDSSFYIGARKNHIVTFETTTVANNLAEPQRTNLTVEITVSDKQFGRQDLNDFLECDRQ
ncbi:MAG: ATP-binding protein [Deinococcota bacterium]